MKAIVCVKQVPDTSGKVAVNPDGTLNRASMQTITNPDDLNAVEAVSYTHLDVYKRQVSLSGGKNAVCMGSASAAMSAAYEA